MAPKAVLVGPPGAGKSTIGRRLAKLLGVEFHDTDALIEEHTGRVISEIFATDGEPAFRAIEEEIVARTLRTSDGVVSLGGGSVLSSLTRQLLREYRVVYLEISVFEGIRRTAKNSSRPLLAGTDPAKAYEQLMTTRVPLYRDVATLRVGTAGRSPSSVARHVIEQLGETIAEAQPTTCAGPGDAPGECAPGGDGTGGAATRRRRRRRRRVTRAVGSPEVGDQNQGAPTSDSSTPDGAVESLAAGNDDDAATSNKPRRKRRRRPRRRRRGTAEGQS